MRDALPRADGQADLSVLIIGVGNPLRGDDAAGLEAVGRILGEPGLEVLSHPGEGIDLLNIWDGADAVVLIDAVASGSDSAPGTILRFDVSGEPLPAGIGRRVGHFVSVAEAIEAARALGRLPPRVVVVGVEGAGWNLGAGLSEPVAAALDALAEAAVSEAQKLAGSGGGPQDHPRT